MTPLAARFSLHASHKDLFNSTATTRLMNERVSGRKSGCVRECAMVQRVRENMRGCS